VGNGRNRNPDDIGNLTNREFFVSAQKVADFEARRVANHIEFPRALKNRVIVLKLFFEFIFFSSY
jgi:hypothetical protein